MGIIERMNALRDSLNANLRPQQLTAAQKAFVMSMRPFNTPEANAAALNEGSEPSRQDREEMIEWQTEVGS